MLISIKDFAVRQGVTYQAVWRAVKSGRLTLLNGKLDAEVAAIQWEKNRQRPPPMKPRTAVTLLGPPSSVDWLLENTALWIVLPRKRVDLPHAARYWLELASCGPPPALVNALVGLLEEFADCIDRIKNPEPD